MLGIAQRRRLRVLGVRLLTDVGSAQYAETFRIRGHDAVLDAVVNHLDEMAGAVRSAVEVALLGRTGDVVAPRRAFDVASARCEARKNWVETLHRRRLAADHHAVAALKSPDAATRADVDVVKALRRKLVGAPNVVDVVRVAAID